MTYTRSIWAEISRSNLVHNYNLLRRFAGPLTEVLAVIKANAYGHGMANCAQILKVAGAGSFGVTSVEEGIELRRVCPDARILIMTGLSPQEAEAVSSSITLRQSSGSGTSSALAGRHGAEARLRPGEPAGAPGNRYRDVPPGAAQEQTEQLLERFGPNSPLRLEALISHFPSPENREVTYEQKARLIVAAESIQDRGIPLDTISAGSSASALQRDSADCLDAWATQKGDPSYRAGSGHRALRLFAASYTSGSEGSAETGADLEGARRSPSVDEEDRGPPWATTAPLPRPAKLASRCCPIGMPTASTGSSRIGAASSVRGQRAPIAGRIISMDHTVVDVTICPGVESGDEVVLIGERWRVTRRGRRPGSGNRHDRLRSALRDLRARTAAGGGLARHGTDLYRRWMVRWETALTTRDENRVVRPLEWGFDWLDDLSRQPDLRDAIARCQGAPMAAGQAMIACRSGR